MVLKFMLLEDPSAVFWDVTLSLGQVILGIFALEDEGNSVLQNIWGHHPTTQWHITEDLIPLIIELQIAESQTSVNFVCILCPPCVLQWFFSNSPGYNPMSTLKVWQTVTELYNFLLVCRIQAFLKSGILWNVCGNVIKPKLWILWNKTFLEQQK